MPKFLNEIDGADKLKQDTANRLVTDEQIADWSSHLATHIQILTEDPVNPVPGQIWLIVPEV